jgi:hypothetical protein
MTTTLDTYLKGERKRIEAEKKEKFKEKGFHPFFKIPIGKTVIEVAQKGKPRERDSSYGRQALFDIVVKGKPMTISVNKASPLFRELVEGLLLGQRKYNIYRAGKNRQTRYTLEPIKRKK